MKKILGIFKKRWFWTFLILVILSLLVWFGGPYLKIADTAIFEPEFNRLIAILVLVLFWGLDNLIFGRKKKTDDEEEPEPEPTPEPEPDPDLETIKREKETIAERFRNFVKTFNSARGIKRGRRQLYSMPWYLVIGDKQSGKSELIANSNQPFPLAAETKLDPDFVRPTAHFDTWVTDKAVFMDVAGRYTAQEEPPVDHPGWLQILAQIRKYRPRKPLNGVVVTIDLSDIMLAPPTELAAQADAIKRRLNEISRRLGTLYPIYIVFTKLDKIAGAVEFFDNLGREERKQIFGITLPRANSVRQGTYQHELDEEFDRLVARLNERAIARVQDERDPDKRELVFGFPQRFGGLRRTLFSFLEKALSVDRYHEPQLLRGIYFTSAVQQGAPVDPLANAVSEEFAISRAARLPFIGRGRSFFIDHLVQHVLFQEQGLAGTNKRVEFNNRLLRFGIVAAGALFIGGLAWAWHTSSLANEAAISNTAVHLQNGQNELIRANRTRNPAAIIGALDQLKAAADAFEPDEDSMLMKFGLYQGEAVNQQATAAYHATLNTELLSRVQSMAAKRLAQNDSDTQVLLDTLRVYLMLGDQDRLDAETVTNWFKQEWKRVQPNSPVQAQLLVPHLETALQLPPAEQKTNQNLIAQTRRVLLRVSRAERLYNYIKQSAKTEYPGYVKFVRGGVPDLYDVFEINSANNAAASVPNLYTYEGFHDYFLEKSYVAATQSASEEWILGLKNSIEYTDADIEKVAAEIRSLYFSDYITAWQQGIVGLRIRDAKGITAYKKLTAKIADENSPILKLLELTRYHTTLYRPPEVDENGEPTGSGGIEAGRIIGGKTGKIAAQASKLNRVADAVGVSDFTFNQSEGIGNRVNQAFSEIHALLDTAEGKTADINNIVSTLRGLNDSITLISVAPSPSNEALTLAKTRMRTSQGDQISLLHEHAKTLPTPLNRWFSRTAHNAWEVVLTEAQVELDRLWKVEVYKPYSQALRGRYPIDRRSKTDIQLDDFSQFFGPNGTLDTYVSDNLDPFIDDQIWKLKYRDGRSVQISKKTLETLASASRLKNTFFANGNRPELKFSLKPLTLDASISQAVFETDNQQLVYYHGPQRTEAFKWPGDNPTNRSRLVFQEIGGTNSIAIKQEGPWSFFRLTDTARMIDLSADQMQLIFTIAGRDARYLLTAPSIVNPFGDSNPLSIEIDNDL